MFYSIRVNVNVNVKINVHVNVHVKLIVDSLCECVSFFAIRCVARALALAA